MQTNQLPTKSLIELEDNSDVLTLDQMVLSHHGFNMWGMLECGVLLLVDSKCKLAGCKTWVFPSDSDLVLTYCSYSGLKGSSY